MISIDDDECCNNTNICHVNTTCENTYSSYNCSCNSGFTGNGTTCKGWIINQGVHIFTYSWIADIDECDHISNDKSQRCINTVGSYECVCENGYAGNGSHCVDINECNLAITNVIPSLHAYTKTALTAVCVYLAGQETVVFCTDVDDCDIMSPCHLNSNCKNQIGSFVCTCLHDWKGNGFICDDINECEMNNSLYSKATCTNEDGSYSCTCLRGWTGDGFTCSIH